MTQTASDGFTLGTGNLSLPNLAQPNLTTTASVNIADNGIVAATTNHIHFSADGGPGVISALISDFATAGTAGSRMWLVSGTLGAEDAEYIWVKDGKFGTGNEGNLLCSNADSRGACVMFVKTDGSELVWEEATPLHAGAGTPFKKSLYVSLMSGKLLEVKYKSGAQASSDYVYVTSDHSKTEGADVVGADFGSTMTATFQTSQTACLVNVIS